MLRHFSRYLLIGMVVVSTLIGSVGHLASTAVAQESQFSVAAATPYEQGGQIGKIYLSALPLNCVQSIDPTTSYKRVGVARYEHPPISVTLSPGVLYQKIVVQTFLLQVNPNGGYHFVASSPDEVIVPEVAGAYPVTIQPLGSFPNRKVGPDYVIAYLIQWYPSSGGDLIGQASVIQSTYFVTVNDVLVRDDAPICGSYWKPEVKTSATAGTVNSPLNYALALYPLSVPVSVKWDGATIASVSTTDQGTATGSLRIPAAPLGTHKLTFSTGHWVASANFTVKPRIKLIPSAGLKRGQTVNVSLRGYAKYETVNIRWKKGTSWVQVGQVKTSGTGSANVNVKVPSFAVIGANSVRGDGTYGHAQTNAVTVVVSASSSSISNVSPAPTKTLTPAPTAIPATATPTPSPIASPTVEVTTPEATATPTETETATPAPDDTATPMPVTETPTPQPTAEATAEPSSGAEAPDEVME
jgi:hypothetical protein